jgi:NAD(P)-dependent dehydrogenase (short-subunit alcohol dehydrogenase family)
MADEMKGKTVLVTGANSGIGFETSLALAKEGAKVIMVARDPKLGEEALASVRSKSSNNDAELIICDMSSLANVRSLAKEVNEKCPRLDVLVNNAGKIFGSRMVTADGFEWTFGVNHLAPFLLTNLLLPLLKKSAPSRIVNTASVAHMMGHINFDDIMSEKKYDEMAAYAQSKLANVLFSLELSKRLANTGVTSNSLHPGVVHTHFAKKGSFLSNFFYSFFGFLMKTPEQGARTTVYLASSPEVQGVTGRYFSDCRRAKPSKEGLDEAVAKKLWELSEKLVKI